jgi:hypothetical protein
MLPVVISPGQAVQKLSGYMRVALPGYATERDDCQEIKSRRSIISAG